MSSLLPTIVPVAIAVQQQTIANAVKASGILVRVEPEDLMKIFARLETPLIIHSTVYPWFTLKHRYLVGYKGFVFVADSPVPLSLSATAEIIEAAKTWLPS